MFIKDFITAKGKIKKVSLQDDIDVASRQEPKMTLIMKELIARV